MPVETPSPSGAAEAPRASEPAVELPRVEPVEPGRWPRVIWRFAFGAFYVACWALVWLPVLLALRLFSPKLRRRLGLLSLWNGAHSLGAIANVQVETHGVPPKGGAMIVSNHLSYMDIVALAKAAPMHFVGQSGIASWPVIGALATAMGTIFIKRFDRSSLRETNDTLELYYSEGLPVLVFLEGTTTGGDRLLKFNGALLNSAIKTGTPVAPVALHYATPEEKKSLVSNTVCWWGDMPFGAHLVSFMALKGVQATVRFGEPIPTEGANRKELAVQLRRAVAEMYSKSSGIAPETLESLGETPLFFPTE